MRLHLVQLPLAECCQLLAWWDSDAKLGTGRAVHRHSDLHLLATWSLRDDSLPRLNSLRHGDDQEVFLRSLAATALLYLVALLLLPMPLLLLPMPS